MYFSPVLPPTLSPVRKQYSIFWFYKLFPTDAEPTETEKEVYDIVRGVLDEAPRILELLENYTGASAEIRQVSGLQEKN